MHPLKAAVLHHNLDEISALGNAQDAHMDPSLAHNLLRLAREMGNAFTITRVARVLSGLQSNDEAKALLCRQLCGMATNWFGGGSPEQAARRVWLQLTEGKVGSFSKDEPDFALNDERKKDFEFLLECAGVHSEHELVALAQVR